MIDPTHIVFKFNIYSIKETKKLKSEAKELSISFGFTLWKVVTCPMQ